MNKKNIVRICVSIVIVIIVLVVAEVVIRAMANGISNISDNIKEKKEQKELYNSEEAKEEREVEEFINNVYDAIDDNDYDYLYNALSDDYKKYKFDNQKSNLESFVKNNILISENRNISDIEKSSGLYQILMNISGDYQNLTVEVGKDNSFNLMFGKFYRFGTEDAFNRVGDVIYKVNYSYITPSYKVFVMDIINNSTSEVSINLNSIKAFYYGNENEVASITPSFKIEAGKTKTIEIAYTDIWAQTSLITIEGTQNGNAFSTDILFLENDGDM